VGAPESVLALAALSPPSHPLKSNRRANTRQIAQKIRLPLIFIASLIYQSFGEGNNYRNEKIKMAFTSL
jgi:hypothetical protein